MLSSRLIIALAVALEPPPPVIVTVMLDALVYPEPGLVITACTT